MKVVVLDVNGSWECHKADCSDVAKKLQVKSPFAKGFVQNHWEEDSLEVAEVNFNEAQDEDMDFSWEQDVKVYPCAKEGA